MTRSLCLPVAIGLAVSFGAGAASAQTVGPDEAVEPDGAVSQTLALTASQKTAIYAAVVRQRARTSNSEIVAAVGAPVPPSAELRDLPDQVVVNGPRGRFLKYAMVEDDVVVVDPIGMRVLDVIHRSAGP